MKKLFLLGLGMSGCLLPSVALQDWDDGGQGGKGAAAGDASTAGSNSTNGGKSATAGSSSSDGGSNTLLPEGGEGGVPATTGGSGGTQAIAGTSGDAGSGGIAGSAGTGGSGGSAPTGPITEYSVPVKGSEPFDIMRGPDDNIWASLYNGGFLRINDAGGMSEFAPPFPKPGDATMVIGPSDQIWYLVGSKVGHFTTQGGFMVIDGPAPPALPQDMTYGVDGNLWIGNVTNVTKMTPAGVLTDYAVPGGDARSITAGPDGNVWFTENNPNLIGRVTPAGEVKEFPLPNKPAAPTEIVRGMDGALWFTENASSKLARMTTAGAVTEYDLPDGSGPYGLVEHPKGTFWVALGGSSQIARVTIPTGIKLFNCPTAKAHPYHIDVDAAGNIWFTEPLDDKIGKLVPPVQ